MNKSFSKYVVKKPLGLSHGCVKSFLAVQRGFEREIELRIIDSGVEEGSEEYRRFCREVKLLARMDHPNIIKVLDFGRMGSQIWYSTEYRKAIPLATVLEEKGRFAPNELLVVARSIGNALAYIHKKGYLHRLLDKSTVFWDMENERYYIAEFSLLKDCDSQGITRQGDASALTKLLTPELIKSQSYSGATDIFMFGALLYNLASGVDPLEEAAQSQAEDLEEIFSFTSVSKKNSRFSRDWDFIFAKLLAPEWRDRYQGAEALLSDLNDLDDLDGADGAGPKPKPKLSKEEAFTSAPDASSNAVTRKVQLGARDDTFNSTRKVSFGSKGDESLRARHVNLLLLLFPLLLIPVFAGLYSHCQSFGDDPPQLLVKDLSKEAKALLELSRELKGGSLGEDEFIPSLRILKNYALSLSDEEREEQIPYKRIMSIKIEFYRHPKTARERLRRAIEETVQYIASKE